MSVCTYLGGATVGCQPVLHMEQVVHGELGSAEELHAGSGSGNLEQSQPTMLTLLGQLPRHLPR